MAYRHYTGIQPLSTIPTANIQTATIQADGSWSYTPNENLKTMVANFLHITQSYIRRNALQKVIGEKVKFSARRRQEKQACAHVAMQGQLCAWGIAGIK